MGRLIIILLLAVLQALFGAPDWLRPDGAPYLIRALSYSFFHANWWHLAVNDVAVWSIFVPSRKCSAGMLVAAFVIAVLVYPLSFRPVIGFSNVLYAVLGLRTPPLSSPWWKQPAVAVFVIVTLLLVFIPRFSATTHVAAFLLGMLGASLNRAWLKLTRDARRYY